IFEKESSTSSHCSTSRKSTNGQETILKFWNSISPKLSEHKAETTPGRNPVDLSISIRHRPLQGPDYFLVGSHSQSASLGQLNHPVLWGELRLDKFAPNDRRPQLWFHVLNEWRVRRRCTEVNLSCNGET